MLIPRRIAALLLAAPSIARAQAPWSPTQPIRVIIPFTPGGTMEPVVRLAQGFLQQDLGQPVVIEHRPGAATGAPRQARNQVIGLPIKPPDSDGAPARVIVMQEEA